MRRYYYRGFTLLELLVAIAIFSMVSVMAYGGLNAVINNKKATEQASKRIASLQMAILRISNDLRQAVARSIRNEYGDRVAEMLVDENTASISWTRAGYSNPAQLKRSNLQRISYRLEKDRLLRYSWPVLDRAQDTTPMKTVILENVQMIQWRFLDEKNNWQSRWPVYSDNRSYQPLPRAVELVMELGDMGKLRRLLLLPEGE